MRKGIKPFRRLRERNRCWDPERDRKIAFLKRKKFQLLFFSNIWSSKSWIRIGIQPKMIDPDQMNTYPKHWLLVRPSLPFGCIQLKSGNKEASEEELERLLDKIMVIFRLVKGTVTKDFLQG
jgi:hypothetical protein